jgi:hypothetical protein
LYAHQNVRHRRPQAKHSIRFSIEYTVMEGYGDTAPAGRRRESGVSLKVDAEKPEIGSVKTLTGIP